MFDAVIDHLHDFAQEFSRRHKQVYLVGGAVRNLLLGRPVQDYDFATDALPHEVQGFFRRVVPTGLQHGTVTVIFHGESYEVTTFRVDGSYTDGRRPDEVSFSKDLEQDLARRDFTINAMALDLTDGALIDPFGGQQDLTTGVLRAIGNPGHRFDEDALRILRLFRFAAQLGFAIDGPTLAEVPARRPRLAAVSRERIREELWKAMAGLQPEAAFGPLGDLGILDDLFSPMQVRRGAFSSRLFSLPADVRWSFWLTMACAGARESWMETLKRLTWSHAQIESTLGPARALPWLNSTLPVTLKAKAIIQAWGHRDRVPMGAEYLKALEAEEYWRDADGVQVELLRASESGEPIFLTELALNGNDLIRLGTPPGPAVGATLKRLQQEIWAQPNLNSEETLRARLEALKP